MKEKNKKKKKIIIFIIIGILVVIGIVVAIIVIDYYKRLDGRECMTCPYVYDLEPADVEILKKSLTSNGGKRGYTANLTVGTVHEKLKVNGTVTVSYTCKINYCFQSSYIMRQCSWNYDARGSKTFEFKNESIDSQTFTIQPATTPTSIYMYQNSIDCSFSISNTTGTFEIYGEKIR